MSDNLLKRGPADAKRVNVHESWELDHWSKHFGVTHDQLKAAVRAVVVMVEDVRRHLRK